MRTKTFLKKNRFRAFSLIELSVVITIISVVLVLFLSTKVGSVSNQRVSSTHDRIAIINKALEAYVAKNKRLPCPARIDLTRKDAAYGEEVSDCASGISVSGNRAYGMVPIKALGLSLNTASDGFGNKFGYVVDTKFKDAATDPFSGASAGEIAIKSFTDTSTSADINPAAVFAIISHGANGNYSYGADSATPKTPTTPDVYEQKNSAANFNGDLPKQISASNTFDDIVFYKDKTNFLLDAKVSSLQNSNATGNANLNNSGCSVSVTGVNTASVPAGDSGSFTCDTSRNFSGFVAYSCDATTPTPITGACGCAAGYSGANCDGCNNSNNYYSIGGTCAQGCLVSGISGASTTVVSNTTSASFSCDQSGYGGTITYSCSSGVFATENACSTTATANMICTGTGFQTPVPTVNNRKIYRFTSSGTLTCSHSNAVDYLIVGGGGGSSGYGGGGGGGGFISGSSTISGGQSYSVVVGAGGAGETGANVGGSNGGNSSFNSIIAIGGGLGRHSGVGATGGSGGGNGYAQTTVPNNATVGQGNRGGAGSVNSPFPGAGGGGAGGVGGNASGSAGGNGGAGISSSISGASVIYAAGGPGATRTSPHGVSAPGGSGVGMAGAANTGNGAGSRLVQWTGLAGGSGIVIISTPLISCPSGYTPSGSNCLRTCPVTISGVSYPSRVNSGGGSLICNGLNYNNASISYTCSGGTISTSQSCGCDNANGYFSSAGTCIKQCVFSGSNAITGIATTTTTPAGTGLTQSCNATGYSSANQITFSCSAAGAITLTSGTCGCDTANNYATDAGICKKQCVIPDGTTGFNSNTKVFSGTASQTCNATNYGGSLSYSCNDSGTLSISNNSCYMRLNCTGGTTSTAGSRKIHTFTTTDTFFCSTGTPTNDLQYLAVGAGGKGGFGYSFAGNSYHHSGDGGSGGAISSGTRSFSPGNSITVTIGAVNASTGVAPSTTLTLVGGSTIATAAQGANGANGNSSSSPTGNIVGSDGPNVGGTSSSISGTSVKFACGGFGGNNSSRTSACSANRGTGGTGSAGYNTAGLNGQTGVVIISYPY